MRSRLTTLALCVILLYAWPTSCQTARPVKRTKSGLQHFDKVVVVSLKKRQDRRLQITNELHAMGAYDSEFVDAVENECPALGCTLSHVLALQKCKDVGAKRCLILEDDFTFEQDAATTTRTLNLFFKTVADSEWDVLYLAVNDLTTLKTPHPFLVKVIDGQTTSGYAVNSHFYDSLIHTFLTSAWLLNDHACDQQGKGLFALDMFVKRKQPFGQWLFLQPRLGKQRKSYSDIEERETDYSV